MKRRRGESQRSPDTSYRRSTPVMPQPELTMEQDYSHVDTTAQPQESRRMFQQERANE
jgi:hypothetical protein